MEKIKNIINPVWKFLIIIALYLILMELGNVRTQLQVVGDLIVQVIVRQ